MVDTETNPAVDKIKKLGKGIKDVLVQDDNPNSPHLLFARMNENIQGGSEQAFRHSPTDATEPEKKKKKHKKHKNKKEKPEKKMFSPDNFNDLMFGKGNGDD